MTLDIAYERRFEMGLDVSHDCWHGAYSAFGRWRKELAHAAELPPLELMEGFYSEDNPGAVLFMAIKYSTPLITEGLIALHNQLPIKWECLKPDPLYVLLNHSDCDGEISPEDAGPLADRLEGLLDKLPKCPDEGHIGDWREKTQKFIDGLRLAASLGETVEFC